MTSLILYPLLTTCIYYLVSRAQVTRFLWSRYPEWFDHWAICAACSGTWYGALTACVFKMDFVGLRGGHWTTPIVVGLCSTVWTPLVADLHIAALARLAPPVFAEEETPNGPAA